jgi:hypothetical protein
MTEEEMEERIEEKERVAGEFSQALRTQADGWPHDILKELMLTSRRVQHPPRNVVNEYGWAKKIEERYNAWTDSDSWFEAMKILFDTNWEQIYGDDRSGKQYGWNPSFGGDAWARVVDTAQLKDEMGKQAYVDLMWSVEHNNGNFIDKIELNVSKEREVINKALNNMDDFSNETPQLGVDADSGYFYDNVIPGFLTAVREENLRLAFEIARETINEVNLRRYRHHIPDTDLEEEPTPKMGPQ